MQKYDQQKCWAVFKQALEFITFTSLSNWCVWGFFCKLFPVGLLLLFINYISQWEIGLQI